MQGAGPALTGDDWTVKTGTITLTLTQLVSSGYYCAIFGHDWYEDTLTPSADGYPVYRCRRDGKVRQKIAKQVSVTEYEP